VVDGFTKRYGVHRLVWHELHPNMASAIALEKAIKEWKRRWKLELIESLNPDWRDWFEEFVSRLWIPALAGRTAWVSNCRSQITSIKFVILHIANYNYKL
jgi:putative endonuclease